MSLGLEVCLCLANSQVLLGSRFDGWFNLGINSLTLGSILVDNIDLAGLQVDFVWQLIKQQ